MTYVNVILNGILIGGVWGVLGLGKQIILGRLRFVNFAHAGFALIGMYLMYFMWAATHVNPFILIVPVTICLGLLGLLIEVPFVRPLVGRGERPQMIATLAVLLMIPAVIDLWLGPATRTVETSMNTSGFHLGSQVFITKSALFSFLIALAVFVVTVYVMNHTSFGMQVRATAQRRESAIYCGIDVKRVYGQAFAVSLALAGLVGALYGIGTAETLGAATGLLILMFVVSILGGLGSLPGALAGGIVVGVLQGLTVQFLPPLLENALIYVLFVGFLLFRPTGLMGQRSAISGGMGLAGG